MASLAARGRAWERREASKTAERTAGVDPMAGDAAEPEGGVDLPERLDQIGRSVGVGQAGGVEDKLRCDAGRRR